MPSLSQTLASRLEEICLDIWSCLAYFGSFRAESEIGIFFSWFFFFLFYPDMIVHVNIILHIIWSGVREWSGSSFGVLHLHFFSLFIFINIKESEISLNSVLVPCHGRSWHESSSVPYDWKWFIHIKKVPLLDLANEKKYCVFLLTLCVRSTWEIMMGLDLLSSSVPILGYLQIWRIERDLKRSMSLFPSFEPFESLWVSCELLIRLLSVSEE